MRMLLIRHGESEWNRIQRYQGRIDTPLSALGLRQVATLANRLKCERIDAIYTSPLQRAAVTAQMIAQYHRNVPLLSEAALQEIDHGEWQGKYTHEVIALFADEWREWRNHPTRSQMPNGESFSHVQQRTLDFKERIVNVHNNQTVLVSTHDVVLKILVANALGMPMDRINRLWITNASISVIDYSEDPPYLINLNETGHLGDLAVAREAQSAV